MSPFILVEVINGSGTEVDSKGAGFNPFSPKRPYLVARGSKFQTLGVKGLTRCVVHSSFTDAVLESIGNAKLGL